MLLDRGLDRPVRSNSYEPHGVDYVEVYHVGIADTNVIEPMAEGTAGLAYGLVWAAKCSI
jgi:hypothetical protein